MGDGILNRSKLTAVVYDKWLTSFGGGEMVACNIAKVLKDEGYEVTFICGKRVSLDLIKEKLNIDLKDVRIVEVWNDEEKLRKITKDKDLFVNTTFMDYSFGFASTNIYYTHFPTKAYDNIKGLIFNNFFLPLVSKFVKPMEFISSINSPVVVNGSPAYPLKEVNRLAFSYLRPGERYVLEFRLYLKNFYKELLNSLKWDIEGGRVLKRDIQIVHHRNEVHVFLQFIPSGTTAYLSILFKKKRFPYVGEDNIYLLYPKILVRKMPFRVYSYLYDRANLRLRAGIFGNILQRLRTYRLILSNSEFTQEWVKDYWKRPSKILYPPVEMMFKKYNLKRIKKKNWICSVGRFFTLGHGKRQEVLIDAFKELYDSGLRNWQLHLVGGVANDPASLRYVELLKNQAEGYPIFFHFDVTREEVEKTYLNSKIYWHAAGYGIDSKREPIKMEHFGITTVEAMSAGCVPVVINRGGQPEIVTEDSGFLWDSPQELVSFTERLVGDKALLKQKSEAAIERSEKFSKENFKKEFVSYLKELV